MSDVIKGFIEVKDLKFRDVYLINIDKIEHVCGNEIFYSEHKGIFTLKCEETYEEIKKKIKEASE